MSMERGSWRLRESYRPDDLQKSWVPSRAEPHPEEPEEIDIGGGTMVSPPGEDRRGTLPLVPAPAESETTSGSRRRAGPV